MRQIWLLLIAISLAWVLGGCAAPLSQEARDQVTLEEAFSAILENPKRFVGEVVLLGGRIIASAPHDDHTELIVLQLPLSTGQRPKSDGPSQGRFLLQTEDFLDPAVFAPDRLITLVGKIQGVQRRPLGETHYHYPELSLIEVKLWPEEKAYQEPRFQIGIGVGTTF